MKLLHIANTDHFSGGENVICQIIAMFSNDENVEMAYVSPDGQIREALKERGIRFIPIKHMDKKELKAVFEKEKPDVIHAHDMKASMTTALACGKTRLVLHLHNNEYANRKISKKSVGFLLPAYKASHIFYVSKSAYEGYRFHKWFRKKSSVLSNILDIGLLAEKANKDLSDYEYDVIFLGRFSEPKNPLRLLAVIKKAVQQNPSLKVAVVGTGELEKEVMDKWRELHLEDNVDMLGFQSNPLKILKDAKLMLMTSRWEGTPMCALESMALGTPIVTTPTDGLVDLIDDGVTGFLSNDDDELAKKINLVASDTALRTKLSDNCITKSQKVNDIKVYKEALRKAYFGETE